MFLDGDWKIGAALDGRIVRDDDRLMALNHSNPRDDAGRGRFIVVHAVCRQSAEFEQRRVRIDHGFDALANEHLAAFFVALDCGLTAAFFDGLEL